jgi:hypothetical protein
MALEIDGEIHLARPSAEGFELTTPIGDPALRSGETFAEQAVRDPALRWVDGALELWFTGYAEGRGTVARVRAEADTEVFRWEDVEVVLAPATESASVSGPAPFTVGGESYLVVREEEGGAAALVQYQLLEGGATSRVAVLRRAASGDLFAFDRDDVRAPQVLFAGGAYRLFFGARRSLRTSIGLLVSADGLSWREPVGGAELFRGTGRGFDSLGATDPDASIEGESLLLYYAGDDGSRVRIGLATGAAPPAR